MISAQLPDNESTRLKALRELDILDSLEEQAYDDLTAIAAQIAGVPIALVSLIDKDRQWFKSHHGLDARETPREYAFCAHAILGDQPFVIEDARRDVRFHDNPLTTGAPEVVFYAGVPLSLDGENTLGTLCVIDHQPKQLSAQQLASLQALARQVEYLLKLRQQLCRMRDFDELRTEFVAMVSHELRSPLTSVCGALALLSSERFADLPAEATQLIGMANRNADLLLRLVNDILDLTKMEAGHLTLMRQPLAVATLAEQALAMAAGTAEKFRIDLELRLAPEVRSCQLWADEHRMLQVLGNLLTNGIKHAREGSAVTLEVTASAQTVRFAVHNEGVGIPPEKQGLLFQKFQQIEPRGNARMPGTGLGLVICKQLVELHGGTIGFHSEPDRRTTFYFSLPLMSAPV